MVRVVLIAAAALFSTLAVASQSGEPPQSSPDVEKDLRLRLEQIAQNCPTRFREIEGFRVDIRPGNTSWYESSLPVPGATRCRIYRDPKSTYVCEWSKPERSLDATYRELAARIDAALTAGKWRRTETQPPKAVRFEKEWVVLGKVWLTLVPAGPREPAVKLTIGCAAQR